MTTLRDLLAKLPKPVQFKDVVVVTHGGGKYNTELADGHLTEVTHPTRETLIQVIEVLAMKIEFLADYADTNHHLVYKEHLSEALAKAIELLEGK